MTINYIKTKAFTIIELSIVLVVIGLIIAGIYSGQELLEDSKIKLLIKEINTVQSATASFRDSYGFLPGDFPGAGKLWTSSSCTNSAATTGCNGDGNGQIDQGPYTGNYNSGSEMYRFWQHLILSDILVINSNKWLTSGGYPKWFVSNYSKDSAIGAEYVVPYTNKSYYNVLEIGAPYSGDKATLPILTPYAAYQIDLKMDDGLADSGNLFGLDGTNVGNGGCSFKYNGTPISKYNLQGDQGIYCRLIVIM